MATEAEKQERALLRERLAKMGKVTSPNASLATLKKQYEEMLEGTSEENQEEDTNSTGSKKKTYDEIYKENMRLVRCRIVNLNPANKDLHGEFYTVANNVLGKVTKYVPWDEAGESYHIPYILYKYLKKKKFMQFKQSRKGKNNQLTVEAQWVPEFNIEILPPLTKEELQELAAQQRAGGNIN